MEFGVKLLFTLFACLALAATLSFPYAIRDKIERRKALRETVVKKFNVSEYLARTEKENLEILENRKSVDKTIILWWGFDGLRLNEDGLIEWISRKKQSPISQNVFRQPWQTGRLTMQYDMCQSTQAKIDALMAQNMQSQVQAWQVEQNRQMVNALQGCAIPTLTTYAPYLYQSQLTQCCCNWNFLKRVKTDFD